MLFKLCRLQLCGIFLFLRFGGEIYHGRLGRLGRILPFSLAKFQVHLLLVDVAVHGVDELDAAFVLVEGGLADSKRRHDSESFEAAFAIHLVGVGHLRSDFLVAVLHRRQVFVVLAFEVFEPGLESAGAQLVITNFLEGIDEVREGTRGLVLIQPRGVGVLGKDLAETFSRGNHAAVGKRLEALRKVPARGVGGIAFGIKAADGPCGRFVDRHFNEVSVFGYRGAVGFDGLANLFAGDACSLLNEVLVESQEFFVAECSVVESVNLHHDSILVLEGCRFLSQELLRSLVFKDTAKISKAYHPKCSFPTKKQKLRTKCN